jgi:hypothetical protein
MLKSMLMSKLKAVIASVLVLESMAADAVVLAYRTAAAQIAKPPVEEQTAAKPQKQRNEREEGFTAWGEAVGGLQAGLGYHPRQKQAFHHGETVRLIVRVRNIGKEEVKFQYLSEFFIENSPIVTGADGKVVRQLWKVDAGGLAHVPEPVSLVPGKEVEVSDVQYELWPENERAKLSTSKFLPLLGAGKVSLHYGRVFGNSSLGQIKVAPNLRNLATGKLELEFNPALPAQQ